MDRWLVVNPERKTRIVRALFFFLLILYSSIGLQGQGRTANWIFGDGYHIKYTDGEPEVLPFVQRFAAFESASCISDSQGELLYYSNSSRIWNSNYLPLMNSDTSFPIDVYSTSSVTNGSIFLPWPGDTTETQHVLIYTNQDNNKLYYSRIDGNLDSGLGGLIPESKNIQLTTQLICEQLLAVKHGNGRDWWIFVRKGHLESTQFTLFLLTPSGFSLFSNQMSGFKGGSAGEMTASLDGSRVAIATTDAVCFPNKPIIGLYDFDRCSGELSLIDTMLTRECYNQCYGLAFSSDASKLYYSTADKIGLFQIDASSDTLSDSLILKLTGPNFFLFSGGQLERNVNGEILMAFGRNLDSDGIDGLTSHLAVIRYPNNSGLACGIDTFGIYLNGRENPTYSLPNFANYELGPLVGSPCDTLSPPDTTQTAIPVFANPSPTFAVFPSVSDGIFHVTSSISGTVRIMDLYGREWLQEQISERMSFDLQHAPAGVYIVCLYGEKGQFLESRKVVLE